MKVYGYTPRRSDAGMTGIGHIPSGSVSLPVRTALLLVAVSYDTTSSSCLADRTNSRERGRGDIMR